MCLLYIDQIKHPDEKIIYTVKHTIPEYKYL